MIDVTKQNITIVATCEVYETLYNCPMDKIVNSINFVEGGTSGCLTHANQTIWTQTLADFKDSFNRDSNYSRQIYMRILEATLVKELVINTTFEELQEL